MKKALTEEQIFEDAEITKAADLLNELHCIADGDDSITVKSWEASTLIVMLGDAQYRKKVLKRFNERLNANEYTH